MRRRWLARTLVLLSLANVMGIFYLQAEQNRTIEELAVHGVSIYFNSEPYWRLLTCASMFFSFAWTCRLWGSIHASIAVGLVGPVPYAWKIFSSYRCSVIAEGDWTANNALAGLFWMDGVNLIAVLAILAWGIGRGSVRL